MQVHTHVNYQKRIEVTNKEGRETAKQINVMDYGDFIGLLQEARAIQKTNMGRYRINRHFL